MDDSPMTRVNELVAEDLKKALKKKNKSKKRMETLVEEVEDSEGSELSGSQGEQRSIFGSGTKVHAGRGRKLLR